MSDPTDYYYTIPIFASATYIYIYVCVCVCMYIFTQPIHMSWIWHNVSF